jgi:hypothetical protein
MSSDRLSISQLTASERRVLHDRLHPLSRRERYPRCP